MGRIQIFVLFIIALHCHGVNIFEAMAFPKKHGNARNKFKSLKINRRFNIPNEPSVIIGVPSYPYHLPQAEPILPGHTLIRPTVGMLKSSIKFPHREQENGSGVYGHIDTLGIKFDGKNERVLYTGFRRSQPQSQDLNTRRSRNDQYTYHRHLEMYPNNKEKSLSSKNRENFIIKVLEIYPSKVTSKKQKVISMQNKNLKRQSNRLHNINVKERSSMVLNDYGRYYPKTTKYQKESLRYVNDIPMDAPRNYYSQPILIKEVKETDLLNIFRIINSLRRREQEDVEEEEEKKLLYVPGTANYGDFGLAESDSDSETTTNKTTLFWKTKNLFNHVKISPEAPDHTELLPAGQTTNDQKKWWFYHQSDFEEFDGTE